MSPLRPLPVVLGAVAAAFQVRIRLTWFVNVDIEAGVAYPLRGGDGAKFFASGN